MKLALIVSTVLTGPAPAVKAPVAPAALSAGVPVAPALSPALVSALPAEAAPVAPVAAAVPSAASPLARTAVDVSAALEAAGDISRFGSTDAQALGETIQALLSGGGAAASRGEASAPPLAARKPGETPYSRVNSVKLERYTAALLPWPAVPGQYKIVVTGPGKTWESYGVPGGAFDLGKDVEAAGFVAKIEHGLNTGRLKISDLRDLERDFQWPGKLNSPAYAKIGAVELTRYKASFEPWQAVPGQHRIVVTGPRTAWASYGIPNDSLGQGDDRDTALFIAKLERALNTGRAKMSDLRNLERDYRWPASLRKREYARINSTRLTGYRAALAPWLGVPGYYRLEVTGPGGYWTSYGVRGSDFTLDKDVDAVLFAAKLARALDTGAIELKDLESLGRSGDWVKEISAQK